MRAEKQLGCRQGNECVNRGRPAAGVWCEASVRAVLGRLIWLWLKALGVSEAVLVDEGCVLAWVNSDPDLASWAGEEVLC